MTGVSQVAKLVDANSQVDKIVIGQNLPIQPYKNHYHTGSNPVLTTATRNRESTFKNPIDSLERQAHSQVAIVDIRALSSGSMEI